MRNRITAVMTLLILFVCASAQSKHSVVDSLAMYHEATALNSGKIQQEMIYLHMDNTAYYRFDRIFFACYVVTSGKLQPSEMSRTVYVELLNPSGKIIDHCVLKTENGRCHGSLQINEQPFYSGYYEIRAYTRYMLSFGPEAVFSRVIPVFNSPKVDGNWSEQNMLDYGSSKLTFNRPKPSKLKDVNLRFYPEGGRLVAGLPATVAFEVTDDRRRPITAEGRVIDRLTGNVLTTFSTDRMGRGTFCFVPTESKYVAEISVGKKRYNYDLPAAVRNGVSLSVDNLQSSDSLTFTVRRTPDCFVKVVGATLTCRNELCGRVILDLSVMEETSFCIAREKMPTGIIQLTLFDASGTPIADRLFFNNRDDFVRVDYSFDKQQYGPMEPVEMRVRLSDSRSGNPEMAPFSVSVTDADNHVSYNSNIMADLLLSSEIKGYVHNPAWYFQDLHDSIRWKALDCLLMIQGWRRYSWSRLAGMELFSVDSIPEKGIEVHGLILDRFRNKPQKGATVSAMITKAATDSTEQKTMFMDSYTTDVNGRFAFRSYVKGNYIMTISTSKDGKMKPYRIILNSSEGPKLRAYDVAELTTPFDTVAISQCQEVMHVDSIENEDTEYLHNKGIGHLLREVEVTAKVRPWDIGQAVDQSVVSYDIESSHDALLDDGRKFIRTLTDMLPLIDSNFNHGRAFLYRGKAVIFVLDRGLGNNMSAMDDDSDFFDPASLPVETIKNVYVNTKDEVIYEHICRLYPNTSLNERADIRRRTGCVVYVELHPEMRVKMRPGMRRSTLEGYSDPAEFYSPDYSGITPFDTDFRRTLYWNPEVKPDSTGTAIIRFYNNSTAVNLNVTTATVSANGMLGGN